MKEIIPLKKDIIFKSKVSEITELDVEHTYKVNDDTVNGKLILNGKYKMTEASLIEETFYYEIPFSISISNEIIKDSIKLEIEDFKYDLDKDVMKVDALIEFKCDKEEIVMNEINDLDNYFKEDELTINKEGNNIINENITDNITNNIINTNDKYNTYKVYIVRDGDTIESICTKYNVKYEKTKDINNLNEFNIGNKIIIPYINND